MNDLPLQKIFFVSLSKVYQRMPIISAIPEPYQEGFKKLSLLSESEFQKIKEGLSAMALTHSIRSLTDKLTETSSLEYEEISQIFYSVGSLTSLITESESISELVDDITKISLRDDIIKAGKKDIFENRLLFLLENKQIYYASKAQDLITEYSNIFLTSKIASDIRPVFDIDVDQNPKGALIVHNLHIHYQSDTESDHKDLFLALDINDIQLLKNTLERAEKKQISLQNILKSSGITNLNE